MYLVVICIEWVRFVSLIIIQSKCVQVFERCNDRDKAFQALDEYIERGGSIDEVNIDPDLSGLHKDPRFQKFQNK